MHIPGKARPRPHPSAGQRGVQIRRRQAHVRRKVGQPCKDQGSRIGLQQQQGWGGHPSMRMHACMHGAKHGWTLALALAWPGMMTICTHAELAARRRVEQSTHVLLMRVCSTLLPGRQLAAQWTAPAGISAHMRAFARTHTPELSGLMKGLSAAPMSPLVLL